MTNYNGTARSNYFLVKHDKLFELCMKMLDIKYVSLIDKNGDTHYSIQPDTSPDDSSFNGFTLFDKNALVVLVKVDGYNKTIVIGKEHLDSSLSNSEAISKLFNEFGVSNYVICEFAASKDNFIKFNLFQEVAYHLVKDSVAIFIETGSEGFNYLIGYALAINHEGEIKQINLNDIYQDAAEAFGIGKDLIPLCEYQAHVMKTKEICRYPEDDPYLVTLFTEVLDQTSENIFDSQSKNIAEFVIKAGTEKEAVEKGKAVRKVYLNPTPDSDYPINDIDDIQVVAEKISDIKERGCNAYEEAIMELENCD